MKFLMVLAFAGMLVWLAINLATSMHGELAAINSRNGILLEDIK